ncbi:PAS domain-containing sensor histidine kinase [uncultured Algimonas sp.]|uniref:sensor histidine kinase n=1 Tax=uncultured Algimonas sp. TaxID=1547920 RepID=UPI0026232B97|nr:PAS domain-containing sensor histidine kinase [uncultured Algimonas sp.]
MKAPGDPAGLIREEGCTTVPLQFVDIHLAVTSVAVGLALLMGGLVVILLRRLGLSELRWKARARELDRQIGGYDSVFGAYPGLVLVWENKAGAFASDGEFGQPRIFGSPAALASMMRFSEPGPARALPMRILSGLADLDTMSDKPKPPTLRTLLAALRASGGGFSASIVLPEGEIIEADGRVAGSQVVLWLQDASIRGEDEREAISRFEISRLTAEVEPVAFVEMMSRAPHPVWRLSSTRKINWANPVYVRTVGGRDLADVIDRQLHLDAAAQAEAMNVLETGEPTRTVRPIVTGKGQRMAMRIDLFPVSGGVAGIAMDSSEADTLKRMLDRHVAAYEAWLGKTGEAVISFAPDQVLRSYNPAFTNLFKFDESWLQSGPSHSALLDRLRESEQLPQKSDYRQWKADELDLYTEWPAEIPEETWTLPNGNLYRVVRMRDAEGGISMLFSDITDKMTLKSKLGTLINVQRATLDKLREGIAVFGTDGRLRLHNAAFSRLWSLSEDELKDHPRFSEIIEMCLPLYHDAEFWSDLKARATDPDPDVRRQVADEITCSDDRILSWLSRPLPDGATLIAWDDITASKRTERALRERAEALEEADQMKSEFVGHVSYQLRTPLTTIAGYSDFLQNGGAGELSDKQSEYVFAIQSASEDLAKAIDDILDIAAIEADKLDLELGDVDIFALLDHALDYVATKAEDTRVTLDLICDPAIGMVRADETRLKQVVYNLLANALRFTRPGGLIELGAERSAAGGIRLWVRDTGVGIPLDRQAAVFESFESSRGGVGLGLTLVQRIIDRHGGWVELDSVEGQGTHVSCYLPKEADPASAQPELFAVVDG